MLEALSSGLPVAGSDFGGIKELLDGKKECFLIPTRVGSWVDFLKDILKNPGLIAQNISYQSRTFYDIAYEIDQLI